MNGYLSESEMVVKEILNQFMLPYKTINMEGKWVSDNKEEILRGVQNNIINCKKHSNSKQQLVYLEPILIKAPTGTGKTTFVIKDLARYAASKAENVIIFVNRVALASQLLIDECKITLGYSLSPSSLGDANSVGNLTTFTYQEASKNWQDILLQIQSIPNVRYVVFDEVHFFIADALFNNQTQTVFHNLLECFQHCQRIYMSATPEDVRDIIAYEEIKLQRTIASQTIDYYIRNDSELNRKVNISKNNCYILNPDNLKMVFQKYSIELGEMCDSLPKHIIEYIFPPKKFALSLKFFLQWDTIIHAIMQSDENEQWLIFVNKKEDGEYLKNKLKGSKFVHSGNRGEIVDKLELTAIFEERVLIATSVLDNGINIKNENLRNVVIDSVDSVQIYQMLGRKRITENEPLNLYVRNKKSTDFKSYYKSIGLKLAAVNSFEENYHRFMEQQYDNYDFETRKMFGYNPQQGRRYVNGYIRYVLGKRQAEYAEMETELRKDETAFAKFICKLFDLEYAEEMILQDDLEKQFKAESKQLISEYLDRVFDKKELIVFRNRLQEILRPLKINGSSSKDDKRAKENVDTMLKYVYEGEDTQYKMKKLDNMYSIEKLEK